MASLKYYLLFDHVKIHNANAISSPLTYGFPAISGFLGAVHALNRKIESDDPIYLDGVLIACHDCDVQVYRPNNYADYTFRLTRNPLAKNGDTRSIIEEGRVHLDVSLIVEVKIEDRETLDDVNDQEKFINQIRQKLYQQRIAGGQVIEIESVGLYSASESLDDLTQALLPAFVLVEAQQDLQEITAELQQKDPNATELDALVETAMLHHHPQEKDQWQTTSVKQGRGWLVPIPLGYQAISPLFEAGKVEHARSNQHPTQFVECIYGLGKWVFPLRLQDNLSQAFWRYKCSELQSNDADIYIINQD
ncbi:type I-F CRISPR-associated protein Csy2 [Gilliamella sp. B14384H2]|uniref:type I-F CRISPR-associated protein Csy2 n=1 Tax=unclassified Gilliamella TaxID=2685620 RepID=UPI0018DD226D|nr:MULTISPECIES: type I-F CRISPR-associated protein Csy2 [unclassified Gilliamella]MBI0037137.1 type I-F CRISPR-associated protein Csy2 [Gilliamella sp. B14384G10]MBI0039210.1 type I-F CRISPR-associated protein Csy2 [Gilliamella sp. B14384G7]MBI0051131.1 type I-F CRISPR-associated protein Csy2 [Gilliamella sp. B14384G13]MBI0053424.1 type I-F CRISPR-associated protein Csy2 [Gilliamella sp. B14384H2]